MDSHDRKDAAETLDRIRQGGSSLILVAHSRLGQAKTALDEGDFSKALEMVEQLHEKLATLSQAERALGRAADHHLVRCEDVRVGDVFEDGEIVTDISPCNCGTDCGKILLTVGPNDTKVALPPEIELVIRA